MRSRIAIAASFVLALLLAAPASAAPQVDGTFDLTGTPGRIIEGPDGNIWVTLSGAAGGEDIAKLTTAGVVTEYDVPGVNALVGLAAGDDGNIWATTNGALVTIPPADPTTGTTTAVAGLTPQDITAGPDGNLWTTDIDAVLEIDPASPSTFTSHPVSGLAARGLDFASTTELSIVDFGGERIVRFDTTDSTFTSLPIGSGGQDIVAGEDGQVAFTQPGADPQYVGRLAAGSTDAQETPTPGTDPFGITFGGDGAYWTAQFLGGTLGRVTAGGDYTQLAGGFGANSGPRHLTAGPGRTLWVSLEQDQKVGRVSGLEPPQPAEPTTRITKQPKKVIKVKPGERAKATFKFTSDTPTARFRCVLDRKGGKDERFTNCESPEKYKRLRPGRYEFEVRAVLDGRVGDRTAAKASFRVKRKR